MGRTDAEAETPILWPPHVKSWLIGKDPDAGRDWGQEEKETTEDEMAGWHHQLDGHEFEWELVMDQDVWRAAVPGVTKSWTWLNDWTELNNIIVQSLNIITHNFEEKSGIKFWNKCDTFWILQTLYLKPKSSYRMNYVHVQLSGKESTCQAGGTSLIPRLGRAPGIRNGNLLQYSCLENSMDRRAWQIQSMGSQRDTIEHAHTHSIK